MIEIKDVYKSFNNTPVLEGLSLRINTGETMVIIGCSGCGKSVLLKHIVGLLAPDSGTVLVDGIDVTKLRGEKLEEFRLKVGMLFQGAALFDSMTVGENVGFILREHAMMKEEKVIKVVKEKLALVGLKDIEHLKPAELSGGMKKRTALARTICGKLSIILYDEPTTGVDPITADQVNNLIMEMHEKLEITSVVVTHDMVSAYKVADRIAMLYDGKIIAVGTPDEIKNTHDPYVKQFITGAAEGPITRGDPHAKI